MQIGKKRFTSNVLVALLNQLSSAFTGIAVSFCGLIVHIHIFKVNTDMKYLLSTYADGGKKGYLKILIRSLWYYHGLSSQNIKTFHPHKDQNTVKLSQLNKM